MVTRLYRRLGARYPRLLLAISLRLEYLVVIGGAAGLSLYVSMSAGQVLLLALAAVAGQEVYAQMTLRYFRTRWEAIVDWIDGERTETTSLAAWREVASAPYRRFAWLGAGAIRSLPAGAGAYSLSAAAAPGRHEAPCPSRPRRG